MNSEMGKTATKKGEPVQVVRIKNQTLVLDEEKLSKILLDTRVQNSEVMVLSVIGAFRKGKSFLLNIILRYLSSFTDGMPREDWMGDENQPLEGFGWGQGCEIITTGILMWSEPFFIKKSDGKQVCILLMDSQGAFDCKSSTKESVMISSLTTLLSSVQLFNVSKDILECDLQYLKFFTDYGCLAKMPASDQHPFQELHFVVRDWQYPEEMDFGEEGGRLLLEKKLLVKERQPKENKRLRENLNKCFTNIKCFLMPHPGMAVTTSEFDGKLKDISTDFKERIKEFVEVIFNPSDMSTKEFEGEPITGSDLMNYFKAYIKIFQGDDLPEPRSILQANIEAQNMRAVRDSLELYRKKITENIGENYIQIEKLKIFHEKAFMETIEYLNKRKKMGGKEGSLIYEKQLRIKMNEEFSIYQIQNKGFIENLQQELEGCYSKVKDKGWQEAKELRKWILKNEKKGFIENLQQELEGWYSKVKDKGWQEANELRKWILQNEKKLQDIVGEEAKKYLKWILIIVAVIIIGKLGLVPILFRMLKSILSNIQS